MITKIKKGYYARKEGVYREDVKKSLLFKTKAEAEIWLNPEEAPKAKKVVKEVKKVVKKPAKKAKK